jgi:hypothetical protein
MVFIRFSVLLICCLHFHNQPIHLIHNFLTDLNILTLVIPLFHYFLCIFMFLHVLLQLQKHLSLLYTVILFIHFHLPLHPLPLLLIFQLHLPFPLLPFLLLIQWLWHHLNFIFFDLVFFLMMLTMLVTPIFFIFMRFLFILILPVMMFFVMSFFFLLLFFLILLYRLDFLLLFYRVCYWYLFNYNS